VPVLHLCPISEVEDVTDGSRQAVQLHEDNAVGFSNSYPFERASFRPSFGASLVGLASA
jgi:hypothetical protein